MLGGMGRTGHDIARTEPVVRHLWWKHPRVLLGGILLLAATLRLARLGSESMWFDESLTVTTARLPIHDVLASVELLENMPPLYFYGMNLWVRVAGSSDVAMRLPSAVAGIASVGMMYLLARRIAPPGRRINFPLVAALLLAISRYHIAYCQQARPYSCMLLLMLISCWSFVAVLEPSADRPRWYACAYTGSSAAMLWMQPFSVLSLLAQNVFYFARLIVTKTNTPPVRQWLLMQGIIALAIGPWVNRQLMAARIGSPWMHMPHFSTALTSYAGSVPLLVVFALLTLFAACQVRQRSSGFWFAVLLATLPVAIPILASTPKHPLFVPRYGIAALVGIELLVASGVVALGRVGSLTALLLIFALATPGLASDLYHGTTAEHRADVRSAAAWVDDHASPNAGYLCTDGLQSRVFDLYLRRADLHRSDAPPAAAGEWWLIFQPTTDGHVPLVPQGFQLQARRDFNGVSVADFRRPKPQDAIGSTSANADAITACSLKGRRGCRPRIESSSRSAS